MSLFLVAPPSNNIRFLPLGFLLYFLAFKFEVEQLHAPVKWTALKLFWVNAAMIIVLHCLPNGINEGYKKSLEILISRKITGYNEINKYYLNIKI